jgi:hypothetical protein
VGENLETKEKVTDLESQVNQLALSNNNQIEKKFCHRKVDLITARAEKKENICRGFEVA